MSRVAANAAARQRAQGGAADFIPATHRLARLVRPSPQDAAVARGAARAPRPVPCLAFGNHVAADDGQDRRPVLPALPGALGRRRRARVSAARRGAQDLGGARLLCPGAQSACLRARRGRAAWRKISRQRGGAARASRHRRLHRCRYCRDCIRGAGGPGGRQCRARDRAAIRRRGAASPGQAGAAPPCARAHTGAPPRRLCAGHDGPRGDHLYAEEAGLHPVPLERQLRRARARRGGDISRPYAEARRRVAPRRGLRRPPARRIFAGAHAAPPWPSRRHDRSTDHGLDAGF